MDKIEIKDFQFRQPTFPQNDPTDKFYLDIANNLLGIIEASGIGKEMPEGVVRRLALGITGYFQDIIADAGIWRSFVDANRKMYGYSVPFHQTGESYIDYELNPEDIRFLTWYIIAMSYEDMRDLYPLNAKVIELADMMFGYLEAEYDDAPVCESFNLARGLEFNDPEDSEKIYHFGYWLFFHSYLMTPAFALTLSEIMADPNMLKQENVTQLHARMEQAMMEDPTGPLALFTTEWLKLIIDGKLPENKKRNGGNHPYYDKFIKATNGKCIKYFGDYQEMNTFFIEKMEWEKGEEHLPVMKKEKYFVVMVNPERGMLVARNSARCIADSDNPYYDKDYARKHAFEYLSVRGRCPADLLKYAFANGWLPDAVFPDTNDSELVKNNYDFIARCYLQQYYRD